MESAGAESFSEYIIVFQRTDGGAWRILVVGRHVSDAVFLLSLAGRNHALSAMAVVDVAGDAGFSVACSVVGSGIGTCRTAAVDHRRHGLC